MIMEIMASALPVEQHFAKYLFHIFLGTVMCLPRQTWYVCVSSFKAMTITMSPITLRYGS